MKITAEFHGILADWVGTRSANFNLPDDASYSDLMQAIGRRYGQNMPEQLWNEKHNRFNKVQASGKQRTLESADTPLLEGEEIKFFLMMAGG